ncbi:MAG TPA: hypothetical protein VI758_01170 [Bacteroidota bacterium]
MSSSKIILIGAISVVFGLYNLSLVKVNGSAGRAAEISLYQAKAADNARSGVQRALNFCARSAPSALSVQSYVLDSAGVDQGSFSDTMRCVLNGSTYQLTIVSHGYYKGPKEPASFLGHEVIRSAYAEFSNTNYATFPAYWYDVRLKSAYSIINYARERQLDSLQLGKNNLIGY